MVSKKLVFVVALTVFFASLVSVYKLVEKGVITFGLEEQHTNATVNVTLIIDYGDGRVDTFNVTLESGNPTVYQVLLKASQERNFSIGARYYPQYRSHYIYSINSTKEDAKANKFWQFYVNGEYAPLGADLEKVKDGDVIEWKLQEPKIGNLEG